jgi:hypothetical protein
MIKQLSELESVAILGKIAKDSGFFQNNTIYLVNK